MDDHVAIVTGGAQNIGEGIARTFAGAGAKVMIADLNGEKACATAAAIAAETGQQVRGIGCNVTVEDDIQRCVARDREGLRRPHHARQQRRLGARLRRPARHHARRDDRELQAEHDRGHAHDRRVPAVPAEGRERHHHQLGLDGRRPAGVRLPRLLGSQGRAQSPDARPRALLREAGAHQLRS